jgi:hypothetical protein
MINYLTQLLGKPAFEPDGKKVAKIVDVIASQGGRLPTVSAVFLKSADSEGWISLTHCAARRGRRSFECRVARARHLFAAGEGPSASTGYPRQADRRRARYRVVRVNDVRLASCGDQMCVVGADASLRAIVRRSGIGKPVEAFAKFIRKPLHSNLIAWDDVETLEPGAPAAAGSS